MADINDSHRIILNKDGKEVIERTTSIINRKGLPIRKIIRTEGEKLARVEEYHPTTGVLKSESYSISGLKEGFFYEYDPNGDLVKVAQYKNDRLIGLLQEFHHDSSDIKKQVLFEDGAKQGLQVENHRTDVFTLTTYNAGRKNGPKVTNNFNFWDKITEPFTITYFISGKEVSESEFMKNLAERKEKNSKTETMETRKKKAAQLQQLRQAFRNQDVKHFLGDKLFKIRSHAALAIRIMNERPFRTRSS